MMDPYSALAGLCVGMGLSAFAFYRFITWDAKEVRAYHQKKRPAYRGKASVFQEREAIKNDYAMPSDEKMVSDFLDKLSESGPLK